MKKLLLFPLVLLLFTMSADATCMTSACQIDEEICGLPNVAARGQMASGRGDIFVEGLAWYASEQSSAVWADIIEIGDNTSSFTAQDIAFDWNAGLRAGIGYNFAYDQWDTQLYWTGFQTKARQNKQLSPEFIPILDSVLVTEEIHPEFFAADLSKNTSQGARIRWKLHFNMFDWELGRCFWVSKGLSLRPFIGVKGGWIDQSIHLKYNHLIIANALTNFFADEYVKNNFWGVGPVGGVNTTWKLRDFCSHFPSLFGDFSVATLWGTWIRDDVYQDTTGAKIVVNSSKSMLGALMLRGIMGLGWDVDFNQGRSHFAARLGYETQLWVDQFRAATSQLLRLHGDLTLQGVTLNCRFDF